MSKEKYIASTVALGAIALFFSQNLFPSGLSYGFNFPTLNSEAVASEAWGVLEQYREFAKNLDLEGVASLSYQLSETCLDPARREECNTLMNNVYLFTEDWGEEDFSIAVYDERQIVLSTGPVQTADGADLTETTIFFTRTSEGEPRVLAIKFCFGGEPCFSQSDSDEDGWWDVIEERF